MEHSKHPVRRCAVYTRKSSEEGLEQDFNSLDAQRDACEAFIRSQAGRWSRSPWSVLRPGPAGFERYVADYFGEPALAAP